MHLASFLFCYAFCCHLDAFNGAVFVIIKAVDAECTAETASVGIDASIVIDEV